MNVGSSVLKTNAGMMCIVTERRGEIPHPVLRAMRVIFKIFIINTIKFRPLFWFFFLYLNIQEHSLSNVHHQYYKERDTSRKKQWKMLIKLKESLSIFLCFFFKFFFLNLSFCSFIFFWYRSQVFLGRKIKVRRKEGQGKICERKRQTVNKEPPPQQNKK